MKTKTIKSRKEVLEKPSGYDKLKSRIIHLPLTTTRPMFGYECFSATNKFFVGFNKKNSYEVIVRLPRDEQQKAMTGKGITPFSHGAKAGWIEIDMKSATVDDAFKWIKKGYVYALSIEKHGKR